MSGMLTSKKQNTTPMLKYLIFIASVGMPKFFRVVLWCLWGRLSTKKPVNLWAKNNTILQKKETIALNMEKAKKTPSPMAIKNKTNSKKNRLSIFMFPYGQERLSVL